MNLSVHVVFYLLATMIGVDIHYMDILLSWHRASDVWLRACCWNVWIDMFPPSSFPLVGSKRPQLRWYCTRHCERAWVKDGALFSHLSQWGQDLANGLDHCPLLCTLNSYCGRQTLTLLICELNGFWLWKQGPSWSWRGEDAEVHVEWLSLSLHIKWLLEHGWS